MSGKKDSDSKNGQKSSRTKRIINSIRNKVVKKKKTVVVEKIYISAARPTKLPQISSDGLSHAGKHLLLLIQHSVDEKKVKAPSKHLVSWDMLSIQNPELITKKNHIKELCNIRQFLSKELEDIAYRVSDFIEENQPKNLVD